MYINVWCVFSPKPGSAASRTFHKIPLKFFGRRRYKYLILLCNNIEALYHFFILNILICFILYILYFAERKIYNHCNTMEIEMTEIARGEKASKQPSLAAKTTQQTHGNWFKYTRFACFQLICSYIDFNYWKQHFLSPPTQPTNKTERPRSLIMHHSYLQNNKILLTVRSA